MFFAALILAAVCAWCASLGLTVPAAVAGIVAGAAIYESLFG